MANQWKATDDVANSATYVLNQYNLGLTTTNQTNLYQNTTANVIIAGETVGQFGIDFNEMHAMRANTGGARPAHAGWVIRTTGTGGRAGRVTHETLVAMGSMLNNGAGGVYTPLYPDAFIQILTQPQSSNVNVNSAVTFTVSARLGGAHPTGDQAPQQIPVPVSTSATITYAWQVDGGPNVAAWANVAQTGVYTGNITPTLTISNNALLKGNTYRVVVYGTNGAITQISSNAVLLNF
jgi:hypothetical protein